MYFTAAAMLLSSITSSSLAAATTTFKQSCIMKMSISPGVIVGGGRIGEMLWEANAKKDVLLRSRQDPIPAGTGPIYIATRNNDLDAIIDKTPPERLSDLVFLQNGMLAPYLKKKGLSTNTQGLIYFAVAKKGEKPIDGITDLNPEGLTSITGKWANDFAERMKEAGLSCHVLEQPEWEVKMLEKHIWICAFMAVGAKHHCTVGEVESKHNEEVRAIIAEMATATTGSLKISFPEGLADRLCAYARSVAHFPTALKEFEWRNGWFADLTFTSNSILRPDPTPLHTNILLNEGILMKARKEWVAARKKEGRIIAMEMYREEIAKENGEIKPLLQIRAPLKVEKRDRGITSNIMLRRAAEFAEEEEKKKTKNE